MMKLLKLTILIIFISTGYGNAQSDTTLVYKKRVLENTELDFLSSYYSQDGNNAAVTGGIGTESLTDITPTLIVSIPLNDDDVLTIDAGVSAYTSASSSNLNPFDNSGGFVDEEDGGGVVFTEPSNIQGSPWVASSGASKSDSWVNFNANYSHSSDDRNTIWSAHAGVASEFDYFSIGFGGSITKLFNEKNTEITASGKVYLDDWHPKHPTELDAFIGNGNNLYSGIFAGMNILDQNGAITDKSSSNTWSSFKNTLIEDTKRNSYSISLSFSQILSRNAQFALFFDIVSQQGWLSNPMQRVYFADRPNYYVGAASSIPNYTSSDNVNVFQLADDIERLPDTRLKLPIGARFNYFINERLVLRTYYRLYLDDWGITSNTTDIELPIKISDKLTLRPSHRYYMQSQADYFAPYEQNLSTQQYYTSDYDLSEFSANQYGFGISYTDIFTGFRIGKKMGLKSMDLKYAYYKRNTGLTSSIVTFGVKFVLD